jgi:hypothetical protein
MPHDETAKAELRAAFDEMLAALARARDAVDDPKLHAPPASARNLAEGYRYLMGQVYCAIERGFFEDPRFPSVRRAVQAIAKSTIDNADAIYFSMPIDGDRSYWIRGRAADSRHWRGEPRAPSGRLAPQYLIFECASGFAGDSGSLAELRPGTRAMTGMLDVSKLAVAADGGFEILCAPERPAGFAGNFLPTKTRRRRPAPGGASEEVEYTGAYVSGRQLFYDWDREDPVEFWIERVGAEAEHPPALDPEAAARSLRRVGELARGQMHFWNEFYGVLLETYADMNGDGKRFMPRNAFNEPNAASGATGGGMSTNVYAGGVYELAPDEALLVESRAPVPPMYSGFHLANFWGESFDYANRITSLNGFQAEPDPDGATRYVIAHRDPGVPNWLDTTGHPEGFMAPRWAYFEKPPQARWPTIRATKLRFDEVRRHLPPGTRTVSREERLAQIAIRQRHVQRRFSQA